MKNNSNLFKYFRYFLLTGIALGLTNCADDSKKSDPYKAQLFNYKAEDLTLVCNVLTSIDPDTTDTRTVDTSQKVVPLSRAVVDITKRGISPESINVSNTLFTFEEKLSEFEENINNIIFLKDVSPLPYIQKAAADCNTKLTDFYVWLYSNETLYKQLLEVKKYFEHESRIKEKHRYITPEADRLLTLTLNRFKLNGLELKIAGKQDEYDEFVDLKKHLNFLETSFKNSLNSSTPTVTFTDEEIKGFSETIKKALIAKQEDKKIVHQLSLDEPTYRLFMRTIQSADARKKAQNAFDRRGGKQNTIRLTEATQNRTRMAQLLGYSSYADLVYMNGMSEGLAEDAIVFLVQLEEKLTPKGQSEIQALIDIKNKELGDKSDGKINPWDYAYYSNLQLKNEYKVDTDNSFSRDAVIKGAFEIAETLFGAKISPEINFAVWNEEVLTYKVEVDGKLMGNIALDLHPRPLKSKGSKTVTLINSRLLPDRNTHRIPSVAVLANLPKSQWTHSDVVNFLHGFGEALHVTFTRLRFPSLSSPDVKRDFAEVPALIAEHWAWEKAMLQKMAPNLSDGALENWVKSRTHNLALEQLKLISQSIAELNLHFLGELGAEGRNNFKGAHSEFQERMKRSLLPSQEDTYPESSYTHTMDGLGLGTYSHLIGELFAEDLYTRFTNEGVLNPETGKSYEEWVLRKGDLLDTSDIMRHFLGRPANHEALFKSLGI